MPQSNYQKLVEGLQGENIAITDDFFNTVFSADALANANKTTAEMIEFLGEDGQREMTRNLEHIDAAILAVILPILAESGSDEIKSELLYQSPQYVPELVWKNAIKNLGETGTDKAKFHLAIWLQNFKAGAETVQNAVIAMLLDTGSDRVKAKLAENVRNILSDETRQAAILELKKTGADRVQISLSGSLGHVLPEARREEFADHWIQMGDIEGPDAHDYQTSLWARLALNIHEIPSPDKRDAHGLTIAREGLAPSKQNVAYWLEHFSEPARVEIFNAFEANGYANDNGHNGLQMIYLRIFKHLPKDTGISFGTKLAIMIPNKIENEFQGNCAKAWAERLPELHEKVQKIAACRIAQLNPKIQADWVSAAQVRLIKVSDEISQGLRDEIFIALAKTPLYDVKSALSGRLDRLHPDVAQRVEEILNPPKPAPVFLTATHVANLIKQMAVHHAA